MFSLGSMVPLNASVDSMAVGVLISLSCRAVCLVMSSSLLNLVLQQVTAAQEMAITPIVIKIMMKMTILLCMVRGAVGVGYLVLFECQSLGVVVVQERQTEYKEALLNFFFFWVRVYILSWFFVDTGCPVEAKLSCLTIIRNIERICLLNNLDNKVLLKFEEIVSKSCVDKCSCLDMP